MLFHEAGNFWVSFNFPSSLRGLSPGVVSWGSPSSSFPGVSLVFGRVTSLLVADEVLPIPDVLCSFTWGEVVLVYVHSIRIRSRGSASRRNVAVSSSSEFSESYYIPVEFPCFIEPLFPFPICLFIWKGSGSHHDSKLLGYSSLEGIHQDAVIVDSAACLGQFKSSGVLVKVSIELVHAEGVNGLVGSVFKILRDKGLFKSLAQFFEGLLGVWDTRVG